MSIMKNKEPLPGDLIRDCFDGELGLVVSSLRTYNYGIESDLNSDEGDLKEYVLVQWPSYSGPTPCMLIAIERGDVEIVGENE